MKSTWMKEGNCFWTSYSLVSLTSFPNGPNNIDGEALWLRQFDRSLRPVLLADKKHSASHLTNQIVWCAEGNRQVTLVEMWILIKAFPLDKKNKIIAADVVNEIKYNELNHWWTWWDEPHCLTAVLCRLRLSWLYLRQRPYFNDKVLYKHGN